MKTNSHKISIIVLLFLFTANVFGNLAKSFDAQKINFKADSLYKTQEYLKSYHFYKQLDSLQKKNLFYTKIPLYNLSILLNYNKEALLLAQDLYTNDSNNINLQRLVYSNALNNTSSSRINKMIDKDSKSKNNKYLNLLAGSGYLDGYNYISSFNWFNSFEAQNIENLKYWQEKSAFLSGLNAFNLSSNFMYFKYNNSYDYDYGNWSDIEISTAFKKNKLKFLFAMETIFEKKDSIEYKTVNYTDYYDNYYTYAYNNRYYLTFNDSMLLDTTEVYHYLFTDTLNYVKQVKQQQPAKKKVSVKKYEYATTYEYLFSDRIKLTLAGKYVDVKQSLFKNAICGSIGLGLNLGHLFWDGQINYEQIYKQDYFSKTINKSDSSIITENYTRTDTTTYINEFGNEEQKIATYDTIAVKKYYTNYSYIDYSLKDNNYNFLYYHNKFIYSDIYFLVSLDYYLGSISNNKLEQNNFHDFTKFSLAIYPTKNISAFGSYFTGDKFLFNTDNYSSLGLSENVNSYGYSAGLDYFWDNISTNFYLKYQREFCHNYDIESFLVGFSFKL